jgi:acyl-coenzyme A synthetase/AMP-(fatty) acid ligase
MSLIATLLAAKADRPLFARGGGWITAGDIREMAARIAISDQERCFLHTASAAHFLAGLLAAAARGKTIVLPAHPQPEYLSEVGCTPGALITDDSFASAKTAQPISDAARDPLLIFFTSGSTGEPKPVEKNLSRLEAEVAVLDQVWGKETGHVVATVSHQHIYGLLYRIAWPLLSGRTADDAAATYWEDLTGRLAGATLVSSPAHLTRLPPRADLFAPPPKIIFSSGQLLPADSARACIAAFGVPVTEVLGSTETGGIAWRRQTSADEPWTPLPTVSISRGDDGALTVRSAHLQESAPQTTGDTIAFEPDGRFRLLPRGDRVAKVEGKRVSLTRVESALTKLPDIADAAALTLPAANDTLAAVAVLSAAGQARLKKEGAFRLSRNLRIALSASLEPAERPKHWRFVDAIPVNAQGKRVLATLRAMFSS